MLSKDEVKKYLEINLFDELKLDDISEDAKFAILSKLSDVIYIRFINALAERLTDEDTDKLENMLAQNLIDEFEKFLNEKIPDNQEILAQIIAEEKKNLMEVFGV